MEKKSKYACERMKSLTFPTMCIVPTTLPKKIFETRDNATFSKLLSIGLLFAVVKCGGGSEIVSLTVKHCG